MYVANEKRYGTMIYNRCGKSGLKLPMVSLGVWHNKLWSIQKLPQGQVFVSANKKGYNENS